jgi:hypothetical protein
MRHASPEKAMPGNKKMLRVPLGNLGARQCRWPVADVGRMVTGRHLFCGLPTGFGQMYCPGHRDRGRVIWRAAE